MAAGDAQRAWFPEMLEELNKFWNGERDWSEVIDFCEQMTSLRSDLRTQKGVKPIMATCRSCGGKHAMSVPEISPRSLLFALLKIEAISDEELKKLDKEWMRYRKSENLDVKGRKIGTAVKARNTPTCG